MRTNAATFIFPTIFLAVFGPAAVSSDEPIPDIRLQEKKITMFESRLSLTDALKQASDQTGIVMRTDPEKKAWKVRELPVSVMVKDVSVAQFQAQLAKLLDLRWIRSGETGKWTYTLWQDKNAREREAEALNSKLQERYYKAAKQWQSLNEKITKLASMTPEDLAKAQKSDPYVNFLTNTSMGRAYSGILQAVGSSASESLSAGEPFNIPIGILNPEIQSAVQQFAAGASNLMSAFGGRATDLHAIDWNEASLTIRPMPAGPMHGAAADTGFMGFLSISGGGMKGRVAFPIVDPNSSIAPAVGQAIEKLQKGEDPKSVFQGIEQAMAQTTQPDAPKPAETQEKLDPRLLKEIEIKAGNSTDIGAALKEGAEQAGLALYCEGWKLTGRGNLSGKGTVKKVLDDICGGYRLKWEFDDGSIRIKAEDWAFRRASMVPQAEIEYWADRAKNAGLEIDDLASIAAKYQPEQIVTLMQSDEAISRNIWPLTADDRKKSILFYASLDPDKLALAKSEAGLHASAFNERIHDAFIPVLRARGISDEAFFDGGGTLKFVEDKGSFKLVIQYPPDKSVEIQITSPPRAQEPAQGGGQPGNKPEH